MKISRSPQESGYKDDNVCERCIFSFSNVTAKIDKNTIDKQFRGRTAIDLDKPIAHGVRVPEKLVVLSNNPVVAHHLSKINLRPLY